MVLVGDVGKALQEIDTLLKHNPNDVMLLLKKSAARLQNNDAVGALEVLELALEQAPRLAIVHDLYGVALMRQQRWAEALAAFDRAIALNPTFDLAWYNRGLVHAKLGHTEQAKADMDQSLLLAQDKPHIFFQRALARKQVGDLSGAQADYDRALELAPDYLEAQYNRAFVRKQLGDHAGAFADAENALRLAPEDPQVWTIKGTLHMLYGEFNEAVECFDRAISLDADNANALYNRGLAYHMHYQPLQGCEDLRRAAALGSREADDALIYFCAF